MKIYQLKLRAAQALHDLRAWGRRFLVVLLLMLLYLALLFGGVVGRHEMAFFDLLTRRSGLAAPPPEVTLVTIDEESYEQLGLSKLKPWPRPLVTEALRVLGESGAKTVFLDILFSASGDPAEDADLAAAVSAVSTYIVKSQSKKQRPVYGARPEFTVRENRPIDLIASAAQGVLSANIYWDPDRVVRRFPPDPTLTDGFVTPFAALTPGAGPGPSDLIRYYGRPGMAFYTIPFYKLLDHADPPPRQLLDGRVVLIGRALSTTVEAAINESFATPYDSPAYGVEIHATVAANLLRRDWIRRFPFPYEVGGTIMVLGVLGYLILRLNFVARAVLAVVAILGGWFFSAKLFSLGYFVPVAVAIELLAGFLILSYVWMLAARLLGERKMMRAAPVLEQEQEETAWHGSMESGDVVKGRYRILSLIGAGGMGEVYRAADQNNADAVVALKVMTGHGKHSDAWKRFRSEAEIACALSHPNITKAYDFSEDVPYYISMEYAEGQNLGQRIRSAGAEGMPLLETVEILHQAASGLEHAHGRGIIHRDIKPDNIIVCGDGKVKITDFGLARVIDEATRLTRSNQWLGTYEYMAPEAFTGRLADHRADIYSFGMVAYEMLNGEPPFCRREPVVLAVMHSRNPLPPISAKAPPWLVTLVQACARKLPHERVQSMREVAGALAEGLIELKRQGARARPS